MGFPGDPPGGPATRPGSYRIEGVIHQTEQLIIIIFTLFSKDTDILLIFIWKFVGIQGYLWQLVCTNKYRIVRYGFSHGTQIMVRGTDLVIVIVAAAVAGSEVSDSLV